MVEPIVRTPGSKGVVFYTVIVVLIACTFVFYKYGRSVWFPTYMKITGGRTVADVLDLYEESVENRLKSDFENIGVTYPPENIRLIAYKDSKKLNMWAGDAQQLSLIKTYEIKGASGNLGPKLVEGDRQVPEGVYRIEGLNPNSSYHLSMKLNYPNPFDLKYARLEGRTSPGTNIFIHGKTVSVGCLAMGDPAIEELFVLAAKVGTANVDVVIAPTDLVKNYDAQLLDNQPPWVKDLYNDIRQELQKFTTSPTG